MHAYTPMKGTSFTAVKSEKKIVQMMCLSTRVHTSIFRYILVCIITSYVFIQIRLEPPCETVSSLLPSCAVERPQRSSWPWFVDRQTTHILVHTCTYHMQRMYQYIAVHTSMYCFIPHHTHVFLRIWATDHHELVLPVTTPLPMFPDSSTLLPSCQSRPLTIRDGTQF